MRIPLFCKLNYVTSLKGVVFTFNNNVLFDISNLVIKYRVKSAVVEMAQSRITSFFQLKGNPSNVAEKVSSATSNDAIKTNGKRKISDSDSENDESITTSTKKKVSRLPDVESEEETNDLNESKISESSDVVNTKSDENVSSSIESQNIESKSKQLDDGKKNKLNRENKLSKKQNKKKSPETKRTPKKVDSKLALKEKSPLLSPVNKEEGETDEMFKKITKKKSEKSVKKKTPKDKVDQKAVEKDDSDNDLTADDACKRNNNTSEGEDRDSANDETENENQVPKGKISLQKSVENTKSSSCLSNFSPHKSNFHPIDDAIWKQGQPVPYAALAATFERIEEESARLKIIDILSNYFRSVIVLSPDDVLPSIYLCLNKLGPVYEAIELGIADTYLMKAIAQCTGRDMKQIKTDFNKTGDLGIIAENSRTNQKTMFQPAALTIPSVFKKLKEIAMLSGQAAMSKKVDKIQSLFVACKPSEARYIIRSLAGKLRIGLAEQSVLQALAVACTNTPPGQTYPPKTLSVSKTMSKEDFKKLSDEQGLILKSTFCECPNYDLIIPVLLKDGIAGLREKCKLTAGVPLKPMLAQPTKCIDDVFQQFEGTDFTCEWKYDGERAQIHVCDDGAIKIFSRNLENNTSKYPDIISQVKAILKPQVKSCIIDAEAVAWDKDRKCIMPFQVLSTRKRKDAAEDEIKVHVRVFMFDMLYINGNPLIEKTLTERRQLLKDHLLEVEDKFSFVTHLNTNSLEEVQDFLEESVKGNCEGLMVKSLQKDSEYKIAKRSRSWLKLKKDYLQGVGDTLDLVVLGGYLGKGKRTGVYGGYLLGCYNPQAEQYQSICKIGTGFSDESLATHAEFLKEHIIPKPRSYYLYHDSLEPDHWFDAVQVWEIKCADLSLSPIHRAAIGIIDPEKGISLRFPRYLRVRTDKTVEDATTAEQVAELYKNQDQIKNQSKTSQLKEEDFY